MAFPFLLQNIIICGKLVGLKITKEFKAGIIHGHTCPCLGLDRFMPCIQTHLASSHLFFCHNAAFCAEVIVAEEAVQAIVTYHV